MYITFNYNVKRLKGTYYVYGCLYNAMFSGSWHLFVEIKVFKVQRRCFVQWHLTKTGVPVTHNKYCCFVYFTANCFQVFLKQNCPPTHKNPMVWNPSNTLFSKVNWIEINLNVELQFNSVYTNSKWNSLAALAKQYFWNWGSLTFSFLPQYV